MGVDPLRSAQERYEVLGRIASGAMGEVYLARCHTSKGATPVVLKRIRPELQADPQIAGMFFDEGRIAALMNHTNIVGLYELGELDGSMFLAMELVEGITLTTLLQLLGRQRAFVPMPLALRIACDVLDALHYAHSFHDPDGRFMGIVHRDVSPQNIMISFAGDVKLFDFGVTKAEGRLHHTHPGLLKGKLAYMAPEYVSTGDLDARGDIFSLGTLLYEMLLLRHPFPGPTDAMVLRAIVETQPRNPSEVDPRFPEDLAQVLLYALQKDPAMRYQSAAQMRHALLAVMSVRQLLPSRLGLARFMHKALPDRVRALEQAHGARDDVLFVDAMRGTVRPYQLAQATPVEPVRRPTMDISMVGEEAEQTTELPHSDSELDFAKVPTADMPPLLRPVSDMPLMSRASNPAGFLESDRERAGRYELLRLQYEDEIFEEHHARMEGVHGFSRMVRVRRLKPGAAEDPAWVSAFVRAAKLSADWNHPVLDQALELGEDEGLYTVLNPANGRRLSRVLLQARELARPLPIPLAARIGVELCGALHFLHTHGGGSAGVLHREIRPEAVLLNHSGGVRLGGFGRVAALEDHPVDRVEPPRQRLDYAAPEQLDPSLGPETPAVDSYAVCLLMYECVQLRRPYAFDTPEELVQAVLNTPPVELGEDDLFSRILRRGTARAASQRYSNVVALQYDLEQLLAQSREGSGTLDLAAWFADLGVSS